MALLKGLAAGFAAFRHEWVAYRPRYRGTVIGKVVAKTGTYFRDINRFRGKVKSFDGGFGTIVIDAVFNRVDLVKGQSVEKGDEVEFELFSNEGTRICSAKNVIRLRSENQVAEKIIPAGPLKGIVAWFNDQKGYGFLSWAEDLIFVHFTAIQNTTHKILKEGEEVEFEVQPSPSGPMAANVVKL